MIPVFIALAMSLLGALNGVSELRHYLLTTQFEAFHTPRYDAQVFRALWVSAIYLHCRAPHRRTHPLSPARHHRRMTRRRRHLTALALSDLAAAAGSGCSSTTDFTSAKMARDIAPTYVNYLRLQQTTERPRAPRRAHGQRSLRTGRASGRIDWRRLLAAALDAGSVALAGFGVDPVIEIVASSVVVGNSGALPTTDASAPRCAARHRSRLRPACPRHHDPERRDPHLQRASGQVRRGDRLARQYRPGHADADRR